jgi:hypothetical protein
VNKTHSNVGFDMLPLRGSRGMDFCSAIDVVRCDVMHDVRKSGVLARGR